MTKTPYILIIEDDEWWSEQCVRTLQSAGMRVERASHALAAMDIIDTTPPDVVVLDVFLPGPNAFTLLHELQSHADLAAIPVVLCTASAEQLVDEDVSVYGVKRVLNKATMLPQDLIGAVKKVLP